MVRRLRGGFPPWLPVDHKVPRKFCLHLSQICNVTEALLSARCDPFNHVNKIPNGFQVTTSTSQSTERLTEQPKPAASDKGVGWGVQPWQPGSQPSSPTTEHPASSQ